MNSDIQTLRQQAQQWQELQRAAELLPELERQQAAEQRQEQALARAAHDQAEFDQAIASFQGAKLESDSALASWLARGQEIISRRQELALTARAIQEMAWKLAESQLRAGLVKSPLGASDAIRGQAQQLLINQTGYSQLMTIDDQAGRLLNDIITAFFNDNAVITRRQPARIVVDTANGPVTETRF